MHHLFTIILVFSCLFNIACGGGGSGDTISAEDGGTVCASSGSPIAGACLTIPPGGIATDTKFTFEAVDSLIDSPSVALLAKAVKITPKIALQETATLTLPYEDPGSEVFSVVTDVLVFGSDGNKSRRDIAIDSSLETVAISISSLVNFQPGFEAVDLEVGDFAAVTTSESAGSLAVDSSNGDQYVILASSFPEDYDTSPNSVIANTALTSDTGFRIDSSESATTFASFSLTSNETSTNSTMPERETLCSLMRERERNLVSTTATSALSPLFSSSGAGLSWQGTPNQMGTAVTDIRMLDVSDFDNDQSSIDTITFDGTVQAVTNNNVTIIVDDDCMSCGSLVTNIQDSMENQVGPRLETFFGEYSDVDDDGFVQVILTDKISSPFLGFFDAANGFNFQSGGETDTSNEADVLFVAETASTALLESTICHELQHLIHFNKKTLSNLVSGSGLVADVSDIASALFAESFVNEGASYVAEMVCGYSEESAGPIELGADYLTSGGACTDHRSVSLIDNSGGVTLCARGANFLFQWYLLQRTGGASQDGSGTYTDDGGADWMQSILESSDVGTSNYLLQTEDALGENTNFINLYRDYLLSIINDALATPVLDSEYSFSETDSDFFTSQQVGFDVASNAGNGPITDTFDAGETRFEDDLIPVGFRVIGYGSSTDGLVKFRISDPTTDGIGNAKAWILRIE